MSYALNQATSTISADSSYAGHLLPSLLVMSFGIGSIFVLALIAFLTGMIMAETATSITIRRPDGTSETILRVNIEELRSTGMSFMPEGLEKSINHQEMADLIAYLLSAQ